MLSVLETPYSDDAETKFEVQNKSTEAEGERETDHIAFTFDNKSPPWAHQLRVS